MMVPFEMEPEEAPLAQIKVVGIGGAGNNAVNNMIKAGLQGVEFTAVNTDLQALSYNQAPNRLQIGSAITNGLGTGAKPELGRQAAMEDAETLADCVRGADMVFITAGMGGGTGTGGAPVLASITREMNILTVAVVTKPFQFEGPQRTRHAEEGLEMLRDFVDALIIIPNQKLLEVVDRNTTMLQAFSLADDILRQAVQGISDLITISGQVNLDFADVKTILEGQGRAVMGIGTATGETRAVEAAQKAIASPLLEDGSIKGANKVLINVTGGPDLTLYEVTEASTIIQKEADPEAQIIFGSVIHHDYPESIGITVIATGFGGERIHQPLRPSAEQGFLIPPDSLGGGTGWKKMTVPEPLKTFDLGLDLNEEELEIPTFMRKKPD